MTILNPKLNKYPPIQFYGQAECEETKEEEDEDTEEEGYEPSHAYNLDGAFLPEQPSSGGFKFCNPSQSNPT
ncbi:hypothetical protein PVK06_004690 [Gossypium arboreum]|uniref:Uncharacterized protein n=1 Tax=Gossypium arboreum TaxID=29729 RepID=A0ABR0QSN9_GOSAR|nr:hypothetical protein PVK06_004690 [Gossypium arboreum]